MRRFLKISIKVSLFLCFLGCFNDLSAQERHELDSITLPATPEYHPNFLTEKPNFSLQTVQRPTVFSTPKLNIEPFNTRFTYDPYNVFVNQKPILNDNFTFLHQNYNHFKVYSLSSNTNLILNNRHDMYVGLGAMSALSGGLSFQPDERLNITFTGSAMRYVDFGGLKNDFTMGGAARFALTERLGINAFGSYAVNQLNNANYNSCVMSPFAPRSNYGGTLDFRITEHWGVEAGVKYEFNPFTHKWDRQYIISPKYYK